jgi:small subunit ribosomal protein S20
MANHKSAEKRHRQSLKRRTRNRDNRAELRNALKQARAAIAGKESNAAALVLAAEKLLAKAAGKGLVHRKTAARKTSRLVKASAK